MTEQEYIYVTDLARVRAIILLLKALNPVSVDACLSNQTEVAKILRKWEERLEKHVLEQIA